MLLGERGREYAAHCYTCSVVCVCFFLLATSVYAQNGMTNRAAVTGRAYSKEFFGVHTF